MEQEIREAIESALSGNPGVSEGYLLQTVKNAHGFESDVVLPVLRAMIQTGDVVRDGILLKLRLKKL